MHRFNPDSICRIPSWANVTCSNCENVFRYLADRIDTDHPHPVNKCPGCGWVFDDDFYRSIQNNFKVIEFRNLTTCREFRKEFKKRKKGKLYTDDMELIKKYEAASNIRMREETLDWIKGGYVLGDPIIDNQTPQQKLWIKVKSRLGMIIDMIRLR